MDYERKKPLPSPTSQFYRCPCGNDVEMDAQAGGKCQSCQRVIPASVTKHQLSLTMTQCTSDRLMGQDPATAAEADELIGAQLGHFEIVEQIGSGGMGHVYRALDTSLQRYVAVKVLRGTSGGALDSIGQQRLMREAIAQARVNHPNIVTIYYVGRDSDTSFLAMELMDGRDVSDLIKQGPLPYWQLSFIAMKITHALDIASQLGIVHADIKPQNLLLLQNGDIKLSDFGMARLGDDEAVSLGGTPNYLAPELLDGERPTIHSDMYALGVTLYEMTFRSLPVALSGTTVQEWSEIHSNAVIKFPEPWPDHLPLGWRNILNRLLAKQPGDRFESYEALGQALAEILPSQLPAARPVPRAIAFLIDLCSVLLLLVLLQLGFQSVRLFTAVGGGGPLIQSLLLLTAISTYTVVIGWWRQSLGRELLHVKIINQYGLEPTRRRMMARSLLRMIVFWGAVAASFMQSLPFVAIIALCLTGLFFAVDGAIMLFVGRGQSLHDIICKTRAVVGTGPS